MMATQEQIQDLKLARIVDLRLTQEKMAGLLGVSLRTYCRFEKSGAPRPVQKLVRMLVGSRVRDGLTGTINTPANSFN